MAATNATPVNPASKAAAIGSARTSSAGPRAKPLYKLEREGPQAGSPDFLSKLAEAEQRDSHRLSHRDDCTSPPASRRPTPPPLELSACSGKATSSAKGSARGLALDMSARGLALDMSARGPRSTPRPSPHPTPTPRAPRAERTPKGSTEPLVQGFPTFDSEAIRNTDVKQGAIAGLSFLSARGEAGSPEL